jgi:mono/diheme cytochrome c family protein
MKDKSRAGSLLMSLIAVGYTLASVAQAQTSQPAQAKLSTWDGVFTQAQADRGRGAYVQRCAMCHGAYLEGNGEAPPLTGEFIPDWAGMTLADLTDKISNTMPLNAPGTLSPAATADILAYILQKNNFPAGGNELGARDSLTAISFDVFKPAPPAAKPRKR